MSDGTEVNYGAQLVDIGQCYIDHIDRKMDALRIPDDVTETLSVELCDDIAALRVLAARLTLRLNRLNSPLLRLPDEILRTIIADLAERSDDRKTWFWMGHVCSVLRSTLLGITTLWAENVCMLPHKVALEEFLRRSAGSPIRLDAQCESMSMLLFARRHLVRAYRFETDHPTVAWDMYMQSLPLLVEAQLSVPPNELIIWKYHQNHSAMTRIDEETQYTISSGHYNLRLHALPNLRRLTMTGVYIPVCSNSLTQLRLVRTYIPMNSSLPSLEQLLSFLWRCPNLEHLQLCGWLPTISENEGSEEESEEGELAEDGEPDAGDYTVQEQAPPPDHTVEDEPQGADNPVPLARLRLLELWGNHLKIAALWPCLEISYTTEVSVRLGYLYDGSKEVPDCLTTPDRSLVLQSIPLFHSHVAGQPQERSVLALCVRADIIRNRRLCFTLYAQRDEQSLMSPHLVEVPRLEYDCFDWPGYIEHSHSPILRLDICQHRWRDNDCILLAIRSVCQIFHLKTIHGLGPQLHAKMVQRPGICGEIFAWSAET